MALTPEQAAALKKALDAMGESGAELQKTLEAGLAALLAQGTQLKENAEIAQRIAVSLAQGKDATAATNDAMNASLDVRMLGADLNQKAMIAAEGQRDALIAIRQSLQDQNSEQAKILNNLIKETDQQTKINKKTAERATTTKRLAKTQMDMGDLLSGAAVGAGGILLASAGRRKGGRKVVSKVKQMIKPGAEVAEQTVKAGTKGKGGKALMAGATGALIYKGATYAADKLIETTQDWISVANEANKAINTQQTGLARAMGQVSRMDMAVRKSIPGMESLSERIIQMQRENQHLGITQADIGDAMKAMATSSRTMGTAMGRLSGRSAHVANGLTELAFKFKTVGIETSTYGSMVDILGKTYRVSDVVGHSEKLGEEIVNLAAATGQMTNVVATQFATAMKQLSVYSLPRAKEIFKELSVTVAETGVEMTTLMSVAGQFDNMDQAAEKAGQLNAMLGGPYLNTMDLVNATEEERIAMLREAVEASGESFRDMDRFKQKAIAQQLGITDIAEAHKLLGAGQDVIEAKTAAMEKNAVSARDMFKATGDVAQNATEFGKQFAAAKESAMLVGGAFDHIEKGARAVNNTMFQIGESSETYIRKYVVGMAEATANAYKAAESHAKAGDFGKAILRQATAPLDVVKKMGEIMLDDVIGGTAVGPTPVTGTNVESARATPTFQQIKAGIPAAPRPEPTHEAALKVIKEILGPNAGFKATIENIIKIDDKVIHRSVDENVDMRMREAIQ